MVCYICALGWVKCKLLLCAKLLVHWWNDSKNANYVRKINSVGRKVWSIIVCLCLWYKDIWV